MSVISGVDYKDIFGGAGIIYSPLTLIPTPAIPISGAFYIIYNSVLPAGTYLVNVSVSFSAENPSKTLELAQIFIDSGATRVLQNRYYAINTGSNITTITLNVNNFQFVSTGSNALVITINGTDYQDSGGPCVFEYQYANLLKVA